MKFTILFLFTLPLIGLAFEAKLIKKLDHFDVRVSGIELPIDLLAKDLKSGFSTIMIARLGLWKNDKEESNRRLNIKVYFDLWEEVYTIQWEQGTEKITLKVSTQTEALKVLSSYTFKSSISAEELNRKNITFAIIFGLEIDPITKDKRKKIRKWLADNNVNSPATPAGSITNVNLKSNARLASTAPSLDTLNSGSLSRGLFGKILDSELGDDIDSAKWSFLSPKTSLSSKDVINEK